jgi:hypothetical protein
MEKARRSDNRNIETTARATRDRGRENDWNPAEILNCLSDCGGEVTDRMNRLVIRKNPRIENRSNESRKMSGDEWRFEVAAMSVNEIE